MPDTLTEWIWFSFFAGGAAIAWLGAALWLGSLIGRCFKAVDVDPRRGRIDLMTDRLAKQWRAR